MVIGSDVPHILLNLWDQLMQLYHAANLYPLWVPIFNLTDLTIQSSVCFLETVPTMSQPSLDNNKIEALATGAKVAIVLRYSQCSIRHVVYKER